MSDAIPLGRIAGFPVKVHWSVLVILWLFTWSLASTSTSARQSRGPSRHVRWKSAQLSRDHGRRRSERIRTNRSE